MQVHVEFLPLMMMGGTAQPCAKIDFSSIDLDTALGGGTQEFADTYGPALAHMLVDGVRKLGKQLDPQRVYIQFQSPSAASIVWDGKSFLTRRQQR